jgi:beta-1,4-mannosyl-glycoprotein beta-1,4-N-acetylglucosaminyltransferase
LKRNDFVVDAFSFFNELDLLEIRLAILDDFVDLFILTESKVMFNGELKPLYFEENKFRFTKYLHKIHHVILEDLPQSKSDLESVEKFYGSTEVNRQVSLRTLHNRSIPSDNCPPVMIAEFYFKEFLMVTLSELNLELDAHIFISDLDEIWNPFSRFPRKEGICLLKLRSYYYYLNLESNDQYHNWTGPIRLTYRTLLKYGVNESRRHNGKFRWLIYKAGWHFTAMGGLSSIQEKIAIWLDEDFGSLSRNDAESQFNQLKELRGRNIKFRVSMKHLPEYIKSNQARYSNMFR